jgi:hypothetical protein
MRGLGRAGLVGLAAAAWWAIAPPAAQTQTAAAEPTARHVDRARLMRDVRTLSAAGFEGRAPGSAGAVKAREWIVGQFRDARLVPAGSQGFLQPFTVPAREGGRGDGSGATPVAAAANVLGSVPGRSARAKTIVVSAHYDHLGIRNGVLYPGADDNASGVAVLLAAARHFAAARPEHPMIFAAFDAEETSLRGARAWFAAHPEARQTVALNVNLDMVSRSDRNEIYAAGTAHSPWLLPWLQDVQTRARVTIRFGHDRPPREAGGLEDWTSLSDHGVFHGAGLPFVYFGVEDHPDHHQPTDTADRIDPRFLGDTADLIVEALSTFDRRLD